MRRGQRVKVLERGPYKGQVGVVLMEGRFIEVEGLANPRNGMPVTRMFPPDKLEIIEE